VANPGSTLGLVTTNESWRKYLEAGAAVGQATAARAEDIAKRLFDPDEEERESAWRDLEQLTRFGRLMGEQLAEMARAEITRQVKSFGGGSFEQIFERIAELLGAPDAPPAPEPPEREAVLEARVVVVADEPVAAPKKPKSKKGAKGKTSASGNGKKHKKKEKDASGAHDGVLTLTLDPAGPS
jgi:hypothetical protein